VCPARKTDKISLDIIPGYNPFGQFCPEGLYPCDYVQEEYIFDSSSRRWSAFDWKTISLISSSSSSSSLLSLLFLRDVRWKFDFRNRHDRCSQPLCQDVRAVYYEITTHYYSVMAWITNTEFRPLRDMSAHCTLQTRQLSYIVCLNDIITVFSVLRILSAEADLRLLFILLAQLPDLLI